MVETTRSYGTLTVTDAWIIIFCEIKCLEMFLLSCSLSLSDVVFMCYPEGNLISIQFRAVRATGASNYILSIVFVNLIHLVYRETNPTCIKYRD